jgi:1-pyrroline-5-carboxylate dehydrogenase
MTNARFSVPPPINEPNKTYGPGTPERDALQKQLARLRAERIEIPLLIGGQEVRTGKTGQVVCPHEHGHVLATFHLGESKHVEMAARAAADAWRGWSAMPFHARAAIFLKAAELLAGPWRQVLNASTMLGQSKSVFQAEIDAACELIDFWRFNCAFAEQLYGEQPQSSPGSWNRLEYRPLEGFVLAVTPFNFTSIGGNLPTAPALLGNTVLWKPASTAVYSGWWIMQLLAAAGLPPGVINFIPGSGAAIGDPALAHPDLAGLHFTGSTAVFDSMWRTIAQNLSRYRGYPRIVGETGGKDFVFAHPSADVDALVVALARGAFEYQGQKCSAASRAYVPKSLWPRVEAGLRATLAEIKMGPVEDWRNFVNAVIDKNSFQSIQGYLEATRASKDAEVLIGGRCDDKSGWYIEPTVILARDPKWKTMCEEIFGPVLSIFVYEDSRLDEALQLCDHGSPYALTGAVFAQERAAVEKVATALTHAAGNFYVNDKPTGAVVGQQPFGGARRSGTNDKAGSKLNLVRWVSARAIKENFVPPLDWRYPYMN